MEDYDEPQLTDEEVEELRQKYKAPPVEHDAFFKGTALEVTEKLAVAEFQHPDPDHICTPLYEYIKDPYKGVQI